MFSKTARCYRELRSVVGLSDALDKVFLRYLHEQALFTQNSSGVWCETEYGALWATVASKFIDKHIVHLLHVASHIYDILCALASTAKTREHLVRCLPTSTHVTDLDLYFIERQGMITCNQHTNEYSITEFGKAVIMLEETRRHSIVTKQ